MISSIRIEVVHKADNQVGFANSTRSWAVEQFFACFNRSRRLAIAFEASIESVKAILNAASCVVFLRKLARQRSNWKLNLMHRRV